jgi:hypothetical protein
MSITYTDREGGTGTGWSGEVDNFSLLPVAEPLNDGQVFLVKNSTGLLITFNLKRSGYYLSNGTTWEKISNVQRMFKDDELTFQDDVDNTKQLGYELSAIATGTRRIVQWQDRDGVVSIKLTNEVIINSESDFIDVGGKNKLENKVYHIASDVVFTKPFDVSAVTGSCFIILRSITSYSGTGALFQGILSGTLEINDGGIINTSSQPLFDIAGTAVFTNIFIVRRSGFANFASKGEVKGIGGNFILGGINFVDCGLGLVVKDCATIDLEFDIINSVSTNSPQLVLDNIFGDVLLRGGSLELNSGESLLQISQNISVSKVFVTQFPYDISSGAEFLSTAITGTNTVYADNGSGDTRVTSVAHGLTIEQKIEITGTTNYNGTHELTVIDVNNYDIDVAFVADDAVGSFTTGDSNDFLDDTRFEFNSNGDQIDTNEISKYKSVNTITITPLVAGTPVNVTGVLADWQDIISRRFVTNFSGDPVGTARYIGKAPLEMRLSQRITVDVQGGAAKDITGYVTINGVTKLDSKFSVNSGRAVTLNPEDVILLQSNDVVGVSVSNDTDLTLIDVLFISNNTVKA